MTALEKIRSWLATYPSFALLKDFQVDYTDRAVPNNGGIFPAGMVEVSRRQDIMGNVTVLNRYNFGIFCVFIKAPGDDIAATVNADWVADFQQWVQAQSAAGAAPILGDAANAEKIQAQNGVLYETDEGVATYMVQLSAQFTKKYEVKNKWLT